MIQMLPYASRSGLSVVLLAGWFGCASLGRTAEDHRVGRQPGCAHAQAAEARGWAVGGNPAVAGSDSKLLSPDGRGGRDEVDDQNDVQHYDLELEINAPQHWVGGTLRTTARSRVDNLSTYRFRLDQALVITDVECGGQPANWTRVDEVAVDVTLDRPYGTGEEFQVVVSYYGNPTSVGGFSGVLFGADYAYAVSCPWYSYLWWPAKDTLPDKSTANFAFVVPDTMTVASNGVLRGVDTLAGGKLRYRWETQYPTADYLYCFAAAVYHTFGDTWTYAGGTMPLSFFIRPASDNPANRQVWLEAGQMISTYSQIFGLYPFVTEKYGIYQFSIGGGMEHQTMTGQGVFTEDVTCHELSHEWWGDWVTYATWHDTWLSEGMATYAEALWEEYRPGSSGEAALHAAMAARRPGAAGMNGAVYCYDTSSFAAIYDGDRVYRKGAWVVHMLRHILGDTLAGPRLLDFFAAYRAAFGGGSVTTEDYRQVAETIAGRDLHWFFDRWIYYSGVPAYRYAWQPYVVDGRRYVELLIKQVQSSQVFTMPIDIDLTDDAGTQRHRVWNNLRSQYLLVPAGTIDVAGLVFDPDTWILAQNVLPIGYTPGPPKIVTLVPEPNQVCPAPGPAAIEVAFHKDVIATAGDFTLAGQIHGAIPCEFTYDANRPGARLTPTAPLPTDTYTLTVSDHIVDAQTGLALDGELVKAFDPNPLPSGDGVPGGSAVATFYITVPGDMNCDGRLDFGDINPFVLALLDPATFAATYPGCPLRNGDTNGDGLVDTGDINGFVALLSRS